MTCCPFHICPSPILGMGIVICPVVGSIMALPGSKLCGVRPNLYRSSRSFAPSPPPMLYCANVAGSTLPPANMLAICACWAFWRASSSCFAFACDACIMADKAAPAGSLPCPVMPYASKPILSGLVCMPVSLLLIVSNSPISQILVA